MTKLIDQEIDLLIIGGGFIGVTLMCALKTSSYSTLLLDHNDFPLTQTANFDSPVLALAPTSIEILRTLDILPLVQRLAPIKFIQISALGHFGNTRLKQADTPLGMVVEMPDLYKAIVQLLDLTKILAPAKLLAIDQNLGIVTIKYQGKEQLIKAKLIIAADGTDSIARSFSRLTTNITDFNQYAITANLKLTRPHNGYAYERFTPHGPLALLPMTDNRVSLVWTLIPAAAQNLLAVESQEFLTNLQHAFGYRLGRFMQVGKRSIFPLRQVVMDSPICWPLVFIGNAAHTIHPVAGQGFNLGLRDLATLVQCIGQYGLHKEMLNIYQNRRLADQKAIVNLTSGFIKIFSSNLPGISLMRSLGLIAIDNIPLLQKMLMHYLCGFANPTPDFACGIACRNINIS